MNLSELRYQVTNANTDETERLLTTVLTNSGILFQGEDLNLIRSEELDSRIRSFEATLRKMDMKPKYYWKTQFSLLEQDKIL